MAVQEFQEAYHRYQTSDGEKAAEDAKNLEVFDAEGKQRTIVPVQLGGQWCLMLDSAADMIRMMGIGAQE